MLNIGLRLRQLVGQQVQASSDRFWYLGQFMLNQVSNSSYWLCARVRCILRLNKISGVKHQILGNHMFNIYFQHTYKLVPDLRAQ